MPTPEDLACQNIDKQLESCGWMVQSRNAINLYAGRGVAVREFPLETGEAGLVRAGRLRQAVLRSAFEGRLV